MIDKHVSTWQKFRSFFFPTHCQMCLQNEFQIELGRHSLRSFHMFEEWLKINAKSIPIFRKLHTRKLKNNTRGEKKPKFLCFFTDINHESSEFLHVTLRGHLMHCPHCVMFKKFHVKHYILEAVVHFLDQCSKILFASERENRKKKYMPNCFERGPLHWPFAVDD